MGHPGTLEDNQISRDSVVGDNMAESKSNKAGQCIENDSDGQNTNSNNGK